MRVGAPVGPARRGCFPRPRLDVRLRRRCRAALLTLALLHAASARLALAQDITPTDGPRLLIERVEAALAASDAGAYRALLAPTLTAGAVEEAASVVRQGVTRAVVRERDRAPLPKAPPGEGFRMVVEVFLERGREASVFSLGLEVRRTPGSDPPTFEEPGWRIHEQAQLSAVEGLYRLQLNAEKQFRITDLTVSAEDLTLTIPAGTAFVAEIASGITGMVLLGNGEMRFSPRPAAERGQVRLFCGAEVLVAEFTAVFLRLNPGDVEARLSPGGLEPVSVDRRLLQRAEQLFAEEVVKSFGLDLHDMSRESWALVPGFGDILAEIRTRKYRTLTYARSSTEPEDITLFDRVQRRNIAVYPSQHRLATRGADYDEDALADYDVLDYDIDATFIPGRDWIEARARVKLRARSFILASLTLKLHESLTLRSVGSDEQGRLLVIRVKDQNSFIVNLPTPLSRDDVVTLRVSYSGRVPEVSPDREAAALDAQPIYAEGPLILPENRFVLSNRSYWYPQNTVTDYATARLRLSVPAPFRSVASGSLAAGSPSIEKNTQPGAPDWVVSEYVAGQPLRYLSWVVSRLQPAAATLVTRSPREETEPPPGPGEAARGAGVRYDSLELDVVANSRQVGRGRILANDVADIMRFYADIVDDLPYPTFTLTLVDNETPGGHSPAYFALLYQPLPTTPFTWRNDPAYFDSFPQFFVAHEVAHQFWGQAVGWKNYHNQWLSEGFAQYFAVLYAEKSVSSNAFRDVLRRMRRSVFENENQGPVSLGYRLGHIRGDSRVFRAIVYNKGALVLHMLRRLAGDEPFFAGLRHLYWASRFTKIGTNDVQRAFEVATGRPLARFFERWIYDSVLPRVGWSWRVEAASVTSSDGVPDAGGDRGSADTVVLRFEQSKAPAGIFDFPVTVTLSYADGSRDEVVAIIDDSSVEARFPLRGRLRDVAVNEDGAALAQFDRR